MIKHLRIPRVGPPPRTPGAVTLTANLGGATAALVVADTAAASTTKSGGAAAAAAAAAAAVTAKLVTAGHSPPELPQFQKVSQ